jgi:hypothetical protein
VIRAGTAIAERNLADVSTERGWHLVLLAAARLPASGSRQTRPV